MPCWQFECILRPREMTTHLLISQGYGNMGRDDEHWKQHRNWDKWIQYVQVFVAPSCTEILAWGWRRLAPVARRHLVKRQQGNSHELCHSLLCNCEQSDLKCVLVKAWSTCASVLSPPAYARCSTISPSLQLAPSPLQACKREHKSLIKKATNQEPYKYVG